MCWRLICIVIIFGFVFPLFAGDKSSPTVLRVGLHTFPATLHPVYAADETSQAVVNKIFEGLYGYDTEGNLKKQLIASHRVSSDGRLIDLCLRRDVYFSNGKTLEAEDVVQTIALLKNPEYKYLYANGLKAIHRVTAVDKYNIRLVLNKPMAGWRGLFTFKVLDSRELEGLNYVSFREKQLSGTGPYKPVKIQRPSTILLELTEREKKQGGMYDRIRYSVVSYTALAPLKLAAGEIDICELQWESVSAYDQATEWREKFRLMKYGKLGFTYLVFNLTNPRLNQSLRSVFYKLLVKGDFVERFLNKRGEKVMSPFYGQGGVERRLGDHQIEPLPARVRVKIMVNGESRLRREFVLFLRQRLKRLNIDLDPVFLEYSVFLQYLREGRYETAVSGLLTNTNEDMREVFTRGSYFNYSRFDCPGMEQILERAAAERDDLKRKNLYTGAHELWKRHLPIIPLFRLTYYIGISRKIPPPAHPIRIMGAAGDFLYHIRQWKSTRAAN